MSSGSNNIKQIESDLKKHNDTNLSELKNRILKGETVIPFIGAGLSCDFGYKTWGELVGAACDYFEKHDPAYCINKCLRKFKYAKVRKHIEYGKLELAVDELCGNRKRRKKIFEDFLYHEFIPSKFNTTINSNMYKLPALAGKYVITTNFDTCLESVFKNSDKPFDSIYSYSTLKNLTKLSASNNRVLIKLHGTAGDWEIKDRIITSDDFRKAYMLEKNKIDMAKKLPLLLQILAFTNIFLFVGCGLKNDRTIQLLKQIRKKPFFRVHYAIIELPEDKSLVEERYKELKDAGIRPIWLLEKDEKKKRNEYDTICKYLEKIELAVRKRGNIWEDNYNRFPYSVFNIYEPIKDNAIIRISCNATQYEEYSRRMSQHDKALGTVIWTMCGSPLKFPGRANNITSQDISFRDIKAENKFRIIIFKDTTEIKKYKNASCKRKTAFESSVTEYCGKLLFGSQNSLRKIGIKKYFDFGYITSYNDTQNLIFCSNFVSEDFSSSTKMQANVKNFVVFSKSSNLLITEEDVATRFYHVQALLPLTASNPSFHSMQVLIQAIIRYAEQEEQSGTVYVNDTPVLYSDIEKLHKPIPKNEGHDS